MVVAFEVTFHRQTFTEEFPVNAANFKLSKATPPKPSAPKQSHNSFLGEDGNPEVIKGWSKKACLNDTATKICRLKDTVGFMMKLIDAKNISEDDIMMVKRGDVFELWTLKAFDVGALVLTPNCTEFKDRYFTFGRSALVKASSELIPGDECKRIVLDGRLRSDPSSDSRPMSLFFVMQTSDNEDAANMRQAYSEVKLNASVKFPASNGKRNYEQAFEEHDLPQLPYMYNHKKLKKHEKLLCVPDLEMKKIHAAQVAERVKEANEKKAKAKK